MDAGTLCVLLVEADDPIAEVKVQELAELGYAVHRVDSVEAGARVVNGGVPGVAWVLLDVALGNQACGSEGGDRLFGQNQFPVVCLIPGQALESTGPKPGVILPNFACQGCVPKDSGAASLGVTLMLARRLFSERQDAERRTSTVELVVSSAELGYWEFDSVTSCLRGSDRVFEIFGMRPTAGIDLNVASEMFISDTQTLERAIRQARNDCAPFSLISEIQTPAGKRKWVRTLGQLVVAPGAGCLTVVGTVQDISEIRLRNRVTQESELTLNQVEEITHIGHWSVNLRDGSIYHSDEIKRIFGYEPSTYALSVEGAIDAYHPDDRGEVIRLFNRAVETGDGYEFDLRVVQPNGGIRHVHSKGYTEKDEAGKVVRVYGVFQDITDRVVTEQALRESDERMKALVDSVPSGIVVHDRSGQILLSNRTANRLLAPVTTEVVGKELGDPVWRFVFEDGRDVSVAELPVSQVLRTREPVENLVLGLCSCDDVAWLLVDAVPVMNRQGELSRVIVSFVDITEHKEMETRLHQSEKMKAVGQLAGGIAHDFNNQLMVISSYAELLGEAFHAGSLEQSWLDAILAAVSRSAELTRQLLAFARKGKYAPKEVDVNALISEVVSIAAHSFDKRIRVTQRTRALDATIIGDASQLHNALLNMALNSRDAMPNGGDLVFATERVALSEEAIRSGNLELEPGDFLRVTIRDTGDGMDATAQKHVFEPFFTTKELGQGTGMGMASVYGTVRNHQGSIHVQSEPGGGAIFTLYFPWATGKSEQPPSPLAKGDGTGGRIMIVDDEEEVAVGVSALLRRKGYQTLTFNTGSAALDAFQKAWRTIDLVLLDMIMPEMRGVEVLQAMKLIDPHVMVVLVSGYPMTADTRRLTEIGAAGFLLKPATSVELLQTLSDLILAKRAGG